MQESQTAPLRASSFHLPHSIAWDRVPAFGSVSRYSSDRVLTGALTIAGEAYRVSIHQTRDSRYGTTWVAAYVRKDTGENSPACLHVQFGRDVQRLSTQEMQTTLALWIAQNKQNRTI